ncbi:hypothetical protein GCM10023153_23130 [Ornithinibacter aureus]|uniref:Uncharacterized protein n=1 Tax=Ornithinibacter aureus TaxID=622664 RepID=A0ABP8JZJ6_9MICO|nr:hypothetical protein [Ornithinibacter aureus]
MTFSIWPYSRSADEGLDDAGDVEQAVDPAVGGDDGVGQGLDDGPVGDVDGVVGRVPAGGSSPSARRRRTTSATVVTADGVTATPMSTLAPRPMPGVTGSSSFFATKGAMRLPTPIVRLAMVSATS